MSENLVKSTMKECPHCGYVMFAGHYPVKAECKHCHYVELEVEEPEEDLSAEWVETEE